jgi:hypothetical protein
MSNTKKGYVEMYSGHKIFQNCKHNDERSVSTKNSKGTYAIFVTFYSAAEE